MQHVICIGALVMAIIVVASILTYVFRNDRRKS